jgi:predicted TIM-barrel enzyme
MSHKYAHLRNLRDVEEEVLRLKLKKTIIRQEFSDRVEMARSSFFTGRGILTALMGIFKAGRRSERDADKLDQAAAYVEMASQLLTLINNLRR